MTKSLARDAICQSIVFYQRHISPRKGWCCAHRALHGGESCSQFVLRLVRDESLVSLWHLIRQRARACGAANRILRMTRLLSKQSGDAPLRSDDDDRKYLGLACALAELPCWVCVAI